MSQENVPEQQPFGADPIVPPPVDPPVDPHLLDEEALDDVGPPPGGTAEELLYDAEAGRRRALASMSLIHKEHFSLLFANCLFLAGALAAWTRATPGTLARSGDLISGLHTIRGAAIFALALYGFWVIGIGLYTKRTLVWPFLLNALLGLWVGLGGVIRGIGSEAWERSYEVLKDPQHTTSYSPLDTALAGLGTIAPGFWMLTGASLLVLFMVLKGILGGASQAKAAKADAAARKRR